MNSTQLGSHGPKVSVIGLGTMGMSDMYGPTDRAESIATIHAAIDQGVTLLDTGDFYGMGHNEMLVGEALKGGRRDKVQISVKFGALRGPDRQWAGYDARPAAVRNFLAYTLQRLGVDYIDIYRPARLDPSVPIEETVGAIGDLIKQGYVRHVGLSEVGARIWELIETPQTIESLCGALVAEYDVDLATCRAEVDAFLATLGQHHAIRIDDAA